MTPLTGAVFAVLSGISIAITPNSPNAHATGAQVIAFYQAHHSIERRSTIIAVFAFTFFMLFATSLRSYFRNTRAPEAAGALVLAAAVLFTAGFTISAGFA